MVTLAEELYLLAGNGSTGRLLIDTARLDLGLGGALLLDLSLRGHVGLVDFHVVATVGPPTGEQLLDMALTSIGRGAHRSVQDRLVEAGLLRRNDDRLLGVIPVHRTHESDDRLHHRLQDQLDYAVVLGHPPSQETAALASLALAVGLERQLFPRSDRYAVRRRMVEIADGGWAAAAVAGAVTVIDVALGLGPVAEPLP
jgi:hypothetical protein